MDWKRFTILSMLVIGLVIQPMFVFSQDVGGNREEIDTLSKEIEQKKAKVKQLEKSISAYKKKIDQKRLKATSLANQMSILDNRITEVELDIKMTEEKVSALELEIESLNLSIDDKEESIERQRVMISGLVREIYQNDNKKYIEILAAYESFSDFYDQVRYLETLERDLGKAAKALRITKEELEDKKQLTEERKISYEKLKARLDEKKKDLDEQIFQKQNLLAETQASELTYKTLLSSLKKEYQTTENEISGIEKEIRQKLLDQKKLDLLPEDKQGLLSWPTPSRYITAYFYDPDYPYRHVFEHNAIDIRAPQGTALRAAASGFVARAKKCSTSRCYSYIMLVHSNGLSTVYGHMSQILVKEDQYVVRGDVIGYSGGTPGTVGAGLFVTGPHLHFEVRKNGIPVNPLSHLVKDY